MIGPVAGDEDTSSANAQTFPACADLFGFNVSLKLATDGAWEHGLTQRLGSDLSRRHERDRWLNGSGKDVAVEIGFATGAFVGLRLRPDERSRAPGLVHELIVKLEQQAGTDDSTSGGQRQPPTLRTVLEAIDHTAQPRFTGMSPGRAEVGVLDRWRSLGAADLGPPPWRDLFATLTQHSIGQALLNSALPAPMMLELTYGSSGDGWLAAPVSQPQHILGRACEHLVQPELLDLVAAALTTPPGPTSSRRHDTERVGRQEH